MNTVTQTRASRVRLLDPKFRKYSLYAMPFIIPLAIWASWDIVDAQSSVVAKAAIILVICCACYLSGVLLFWWNALAQNHWKSKSE